MRPASGFGGFMWKPLLAWKPEKGEVLEEKLLIFVAIVLLFTFSLMWLMNYVFAPSFLLAVFGATQLTFWKTFAFSVVVGWLCSKSISDKS